MPSVFRRILEGEKAAIEAEQEKKRLAREAAHKRLKEARRAVKDDPGSHHPSDAFHAA